MGPAVTVIPVKASPHGEILILPTRVGNISNQDIDVFLVLLEPLGVMASNYCGSHNEVAVVKMVIIVTRIAEVQVQVACLVRRRGYDTTPGACLS